MRTYSSFKDRSDSILPIGERTSCNEGLIPKKQGVNAF